MEEKDMFYLCANKSIEEIQQMIDNGEDEEVIAQAIRYAFSRLLMHSSSEDDSIPCDIIVGEEEAMGLSTLQMPHTELVWQDPVEGYITFKLGGGGYLDLDDLTTTEKMSALRYIY